MEADRADGAPDAGYPAGGQSGGVSAGRSGGDGVPCVPEAWARVGGDAGRAGGRSRRGHRALGADGTAGRAAPAGHLRAGQLAAGTAAVLAGRSACDPAPPLRRGVYGLLFHAGLIPDRRIQHPMGTQRPFAAAAGCGLAAGGCVSGGAVAGAAQQICAAAAEAGAADVAGACGLRF